MLSADDFIEVYRDGHWVGTAWPARKLTESQKKEIWAARSDMYREIRDLHDAATRLRRTASAGATATDATPSAAAVPAEDPLTPGGEDLAELIGLLDGPGRTTTTPVTP